MDFHQFHIFKFKLVSGEYSRWGGLPPFHKKLTKLRMCHFKVFVALLCYKFLSIVCLLTRRSLEVVEQNFLEELKYYESEYKIIIL